jgi:chromate reductase
MTNILGIPGSLREHSITSRLLHAALRELPTDVNRRVFTGIADMPHFSPDIDDETVGDAVKNWRDHVAWADGVVFCTPEYAFGIPGSFKNILDWAVSSGEFNAKPVIAISASPLESGGARALASLLPTLVALGTQLVSGGAITVPFVKSKLTPSGGISDDELLSTFRTALAQLLNRCS